MTDKKIDVNNHFTIMQKDVYQKAANAWSIDARDHVVGSFDAHNNFEGYELLFDKIDTTHMIGLDFGCGPGRNLVKYANRFRQLDGADLSEINLEKAKIWMIHNNIDISTLYLTNGIELNTVPSDYYDFVMSTITLQHIPVYDIRYNILNDMFRVLRNNGWISIQMGFGDAKQDAVDYYENNYDANSTNGTMDVRITSIEQVENDLSKIGFVNIECIINDVGPGNNHSNWIFFKGQKIII